MAGREAWKQYERDAFAVIGGKRIPVSGRREADPDGTVADFPEFYVEVRRREQARPLRWFTETAAKAAASKQIPVLVFKGPLPHLSPLVILRWKDFAEVVKRARHREHPGFDPGREGGNRHPEPSGGQD